MWPNHLPKCMRGIDIYRIHNVIRNCMRGVEVPENNLANCMRGDEISSTSKYFARSFDQKYQLYQFVWWSLFKSTEFFQRGNPAGLDVTQSPSKLHERCWHLPILHSKLHERGWIFRRWPGKLPERCWHFHQEVNVSFEVFIKNINFTKCFWWSLLNDDPGEVP